MFKVSGDTVGKATFEVCPDEFVGIELRGVSRKMVRVDSWIVPKERLSELGLVERAAVPEKDDRSREMPRKMSEKLPDLFALKISVGIEARVESEAFPFRRDGDGRDRRDFGPTSGNNKGWRVSLLCPSPLDVRDEREPTLIQEYQVGAKPFGLFLYEATRDISSDEWLAPFAPWLSSEVSGSSTPKNSLDSINFRYRVEPGISCARSDRYASESRGPSKNPLPRALSPALGSSFSFVPRKEAAVDPNEVWLSNLPPPSDDKPDATGLRNLKMPPVSRPRNDTCVLFSVTERPDAVGLPMSGVCLEVSSRPPRLPPLYRLNCVSINC